MLKKLLKKSEMYYFLNVKQNWTIEVACNQFMTLSIVGVTMSSTTTIGVLLQSVDVLGFGQTTRDHLCTAQTIPMVR